MVRVFPSSMNPLSFSFIPRLLLLPLLFLAAVPITAEAHEDTAVTHDAKDGKLERLPEEYLPASFDTAKRVLRIKDHRMEFPPFLKALLPKPEDSEYLFAASWYHNKELMPPYLNIRVKAKGGEFRHAILIDLASLKIFAVTKLTPQADGSVERKPIDLVPWSEEIAKSVSKIEK